MKRQKVRGSLKNLLAFRPLRLNGISVRALKGLVAKSLSLLTVTFLPGSQKLRKPSTACLMILTTRTETENKIPNFHFRNSCERLV